MSEQRKGNNEGWGALFQEQNKAEKGPDMSGTITISGLEMRIAVWPSRKAQKEGGKNYRPVKIEYKQGSEWVLVRCRPSDIVATGAAASTASEGGEAVPEDMPF